MNLLDFAEARKGWIVGAFAVGILAATAAMVPIDFVTCLLQYDYLNYFLMAEHAARTGVSAASYAVNLPQITYATGPGYIYAPIMSLIGSYEGRIRAIEAFNLLVYAAYIGLSIFYLYRTLPERLRVVGAALFSLTASLQWSSVHDILLPNADFLPAMAAVTSFLLATAPRLTDARKFLLITLVCALSFPIKMSVATFLFAFAILFTVRLRSQNQVRKRDLHLVIVALAVTAALFISEAALVQHYFSGAVSSYLLSKGTAPHSVLGGVADGATNFLFAALPEAIIPNFHYVFFPDLLARNNSVTPYVFTLRNVFGVLIGGGISAMVVIGALRLWRTSRYEIIVLLIQLPIFAIVANSTSRYILGIKPVLWACFLAAAVPLYRCIRPHRAALVASAVLVAATALWTANSYLSHRSKNLGSLTDIPGAFSYVREVGFVYKSVGVRLSEFQRQGPVQAVHVTNPRYDSTVWSAALHLDNVDIATSTPGELRGRKLVMPVVCRKPWCDNLEASRAEYQVLLAKRCLATRLVQSWANPSARAELWEVLPASSCRRPAL